MAEAGVAEAIRRGMGDCSPAERKVARVLLAAYPSAGFETIARLAERSGVSGPTVIRFVNRLGYKGFPDFHEALRHDLDERSAAHLRRADPARRAAVLEDMGRRDVMVLFDYRRYEDESLRLAQHARSRRASVVLFTDTWLSPISAEADVVLTSETPAPSPFDAFTPVMLLVETIVAGCFEALGDVATGRMARADRTATELGLY